MLLWGGMSGSGKQFFPRDGSGGWESASYNYFDGNLMSQGRWNYSWDWENRLVQVGSLGDAPVESRRSIQMEYDWQGRRIKRTVWTTANGTTWTVLTVRKYVYDGWNVVAELDGNNNLIQSYLWGLDLSGTMQGAGGVGGLLAVKPGNGIASFAAMDGNGNVTGLVNGSAGPSVNGAYEYGPFGEPIRVTGTMGKANPFRWSTKFTDDETDLVYYGKRFYNPSTGRFLNRDPLEEAGGPNLYAFVKNNPVNSIDPFGLESFQFAVTTIIRPPDAEQGVKTKHVVVIDEYGKTTRINQFIGYTDLIIEAPTGGGRLGESVTGSHPKFKVRMWGVAWSAVLGPLFNIDYDVTFDLDLCRRKGTLSGEHDTYPSYNVQGIGRQLYDYTQKGNPVVELLGKGGVKIPVTNFDL